MIEKKLDFYRYKGLGKSNFNLLLNSLGSILIKGGGMIVSIIIIPLYMCYFPDDSTLGVWYSIVSVLSWILTIDLGIGNGLRNNLTKALSNKDQIGVRKLISSSYLILGGLILLLALIFLILSLFVNWNIFFNVSGQILDSRTLRTIVNISMLGILFSFFSKICGSIFFAIQKAALNSLVGLCSNVLMILFLVIVRPTGDLICDFKTIAIYHAIAMNVPFIIATVFLFTKTMFRDAIPSIKYFSWISAKSVVGLGLFFLILQVLFMILTVTNEWFISYFYSPEFCVDYQIYNKVFTVIGSFYMIALTPFWSAITKAQAEKKISWLKKTIRLLYGSVLVVILIQFLLIPIASPIVDIWLGANTIMIDKSICIVFVLYDSVLLLNYVESTIVCGLGKLKLQLVCYMVAVVIKVLGIVCIHNVNNSWILVIICATIGLLPYVLIQPFFINKEIKQLQFE